MPRLNGILETVLYVDDLDRAAAFYQDVMAMPVLFEDARMRAFDSGGDGVLLLFVRGATLEPVKLPFGTIPPHDGQGPLHMAFAVEASELPVWRARLEERGIEIESTVDWPKGGKSLYFRDPDGHCLELATPGLWKP